MSNADKLTDFAITKLNSLFDSVNHALPTATKYVLEATAVGCAINVLVAWIITIAAVVMWTLFFRWFALVKDYNDRDWAGPTIIRCIAAIVLSLLALLLQVVNIWSYVGIFHPELYIVHNVIVSVT